MSECIGVFDIAKVYLRIVSHSQCIFGLSGQAPVTETISLKGKAYPEGSQTLRGADKEIASKAHLGSRPTGCRASQDVVGRAHCLLSGLGKHAEVRLMCVWRLQSSTVWLIAPCDANATSQFSSKYGALGDLFHCIPTTLLETSVFYCTISLLR